jgi:chromate transport protein ChrA
MSKLINLWSAGTLAVFLPSVYKLMRDRRTTGSERDDRGLVKFIFATSVTWPLWLPVVGVVIATGNQLKMNYTYNKETKAMSLTFSN